MDIKYIVNQDFNHFGDVRFKELFKNQGYVVHMLAILFMMKSLKIPKG